MEAYLKPEECVEGGLYRIHSRNLAYGVYKAEQRGFVGIREKFGSHYLFTEYHWDNGPPFGTVRPIEFIEQCPITDLAESHLVEDEKIGKCWRTNKPLFDWLKERDKSYQPPKAEEDSDG